MVYIGVIGESVASEENARHAFETGRLIAERGAVLVCGGGDGVMLNAARGAKSAGGVTVGILPGWSHGDANAYIDFPIVTGMGELRNAIIVRTSHGIVAIGGGYGTLIEVAFSLSSGTPLVAIDSWLLERPGCASPRRAASPAAALDIIFADLESTMGKAAGLARARLDRGPAIGGGNSPARPLEGREG